MDTERLNRIFGLGPKKLFKSPSWPKELVPQDHKVPLDWMAKE
jgi:hypothetical protein